MDSQKEEAAGATRAAVSNQQAQSNSSGDNWQDPHEPPAHFDDIPPDESDAANSCNEPPRPLMREIPPADPFPIAALGGTFSTVAEAIHDVVRAPKAICGQSVLAVATLTAQAHIDVEMPHGDVKPCSNLFLSIGLSGERKTGVDGKALWPVEKFEAQLREKYSEDVFSYQNEKTAWDVKRKTLEKKHKNDPAALRKELGILGPAPITPPKPIIACTEPTYEGLCRLYAEGRPSLGIFSGEGGQFIGGHGMTEENKLRTAAGMSELWDGKPIKRVRALDGSSVMPGRRLSAHLMTQPSVAALLLGDDLLKDQGLLSRMLVTMPDSTIGTRFNAGHTVSPASDGHIKRYGATIISIFEMPLPFAQDKANGLLPRPLAFSPAAQNQYFKYADHIEANLKSGGIFEPIRGLANKLPEHAARLAAVLNFCDNPSIGEIDAEHFDAGVALANHYAGEALRLFSAARVSTDIALAQRLLTWIQTSWMEPFISLPDIYQKGPNSIRDKAKAEKMVKILTDHGWLVSAGTGEVSGKQRRETWRIVKWV